MVCSICHKSGHNKRTCKKTGEILAEQALKGVAFEVACMALDAALPGAGTTVSSVHACMAAYEAMKRSKKKKFETGADFLLAVGDFFSD